MFSKKKITIFFNRSIVCYRFIEQIIEFKNDSLHIELKYKVLDFSLFSFYQIEVKL